MSNFTALELGISEERQKQLYERTRQLMISHTDLTAFLLALDRQQDLSSLEKITIASTVTFWLIKHAEFQAKSSDRKVPLTSHS